ncbi:uncharacterized protein LOC144578489 isoform X1 [Callithrix jacchus]
METAAQLERLFWLCPPSCSMPGEGRAICCMLEAGACGTTARLAAVGGSDGDCRVPERSEKVQEHIRDLIDQASHLWTTKSLYVSSGQHGQNLLRDNNRQNLLTMTASKEEGP